MQVKYNTSAHSVYRIDLHVIFVTKFRRKCLSDAMLSDLREIILQTLLLWNCELTEFGGESDHIHMLIGIHPAAQISKLVNHLKSISSRKMRALYTKELRHFYWIPVLWSGSYFVCSTGGAPMTIIKQYIEQQVEFA